MHEGENKVHEEERGGKQKLRGERMTEKINGASSAKGKN